MNPQLYDQLISDKAGKNIQWGKMTVTSTNGVEKLDSNMQNNETGPLYYVIHKNKIKMDQRPKWETRIHKILEENTGSNLFDLGRSNFLLDMSPKGRDQSKK